MVCCVTVLSCCLQERELLARLRWASQWLKEVPHNLVLLTRTSWLTHCGGLPSCEFAVVLYHTVDWCNVGTCCTYSAQEDTSERGMVRPRDVQSCPCAFLFDSIVTLVVAALYVICCRHVLVSDIMLTAAATAPCAQVYHVCACYDCVFQLLRPVSK